MLDDETIGYQRELLVTYRRTLAHLLRQAAQYGGELYAPPHLANNLYEVREHIRQIKTSLRSNGVEVDEQPDDVVYSSSPPQKPSLEVDSPEVRQPTFVGRGSGQLSNVRATRKRFRIALVLFALGAAILLAWPFLRGASQISATVAGIVKPESPASTSAEDVLIKPSPSSSTSAVIIIDAASLRSLAIATVTLASTQIAT